jgi:hypothetical protein
MPCIGGQPPGVRISPGQATIAVHVLVLSIADSGICPARKSSREGGKEARIVYSRDCRANHKRGKLARSAPRAGPSNFSRCASEPFGPIRSTFDRWTQRVSVEWGDALCEGRRPFSFMWELDWRLRQEPVRNENKYRPTPAFVVEPSRSNLWETPLHNHDRHPPTAFDAIASTLPIRKCRLRESVRREWRLVHLASARHARQA